MQLYDPKAVSSQKNHRRAPPLASLEGKTIGLLCNTKLNADVLLLKTATLFQAKYGGDILPMVWKRNPSAPAPTELLTNLCHEADYLITAAGD